MATATYKGLTDASGNANIYRKTSSIETALILGKTGYGVDFKAWGNTAGDYMQWDASENRLKIYAAGGIYLSPTKVFRGIEIGEDADTAGSGIALDYTNWTFGAAPAAQGNGIFCDDGGKTWAAGGYIEGMTVRLLSTAAVTGGKDVSMTPFHPDLTLNANYTGVGGLSSIWGNTTIKSGKTIDTSGGHGDVGGGSFGLDVVGILASNAHGCGVSVGLGGSGTKNGIITGFRVRIPTGTVLWNGFASVPDGQGVTQDSAAGVTGDKFLKVYVGTTLYTIAMLRA